MPDKDGSNDRDPSPSSLDWEAVSDWEKPPTVSRRPGGLRLRFTRTQLRRHRREA